MPEIIEVYIKTEQAIISQAVIGRPMSDGVTTHYCTVRETAKEEKAMSEADRLALEVMKDFADSKGARLEVCDVSTFRGKLRARLKGIKTTPAIVIGRARIEGDQVSKLSRSTLESCFEKQ
jgi:hypothetical protein